MQAASVLRSDACHSTLRAAVKFCAGCVADEVAAGVRRTLGNAGAGGSAEDESIAVPRMVPLLANIPRDLLSRDPGMCSGMMQLEEVQAFLHGVYARGPFLDQPP